MIIRDFSPAVQAIREGLSFWTSGSIGFQLRSAGYIDPSSSLGRYIRISKDIQGRICVGAISNFYNETMED